MEGLDISSSIHSLQNGMRVAFGSMSNAKSTQTHAKTATSYTNEYADIDGTDKKITDEKLKQELTRLTERLNVEMNPLNLSVRFGYNDKIGEMFVSVFEKDSNKLLRKFPTDEAIDLMAKMREINGIIFDKKA